jgi:hypothetical protein
LLSQCLIVLAQLRPAAIQLNENNFDKKPESQRTEKRHERNLIPGGQSFKPLAHG